MIQYLGTGRSNSLNIDDSDNKLGRLLSFARGDLFSPRQATAQETARQVAAMRRGQPAQTLISRLLAGPEIYQCIQHMVQAGSTSDRFLVSLYRIAIDPSGNHDEARMQFLRQKLRNQGRQAVAIQMIESEAKAANQTEVISIKMNQVPASLWWSVRKIGPNGLTARLLSRK